jgi:hypothetical protein
MKKGAVFTFRLPAALRNGLDQVRGTQTAGRFVLGLITRSLLRAGIIDKATAELTMARAPRSDRGVPRGKRSEREVARRRRGRAAAERLAGDRIPRNEQADAPRRRRKSRDASE